jgi:DNA-binding HxlR family transcriptional regulator
MQPPYTGRLHDATMSSMLERTYPDQICSIARALEVVGERWSVLIVRDAFLGRSRFSEFQRSLGIARNVLAARLAHLVDEGVLEHADDGQYLLTRKGRELSPVLHQLLKWGDAHYAPDGPPRLTLHHGCGGEVGADMVCARCGEHVRPGEIDLVRGPGATNVTSRSDSDPETTFVS